MRILLAEDNPNNQALASKQLRCLGHTCRTAQNGLEVLDLLRSDGRFDCILMDVHMPKMDGLETARCIRQEFADESSRPPIIAVTANTTPGSRETCLAAGMVGFLTKPLGLSVLQAALDGLAGMSAPEELVHHQAREPSTGDIDFELFDSIMDGGDDEAREIFEDFCQWTSERIVELHALARKSEIDAFVHLAHQMKGSLATFGLVTLSDQMAALQAAVESGSLLAKLDDDWGTRQREVFLEAVALLRVRI